MSPSAGEFDDDERFDDDEFWNYVPRKDRIQQSRVPPGAPRRGDGASHSQAPKTEQPPWKRSRETPWERWKEYRPADDVANIQLALAPNRLSGPPAPHPGIKYRRTAQLAGASMIMAGAFVGYKLSSVPPALLTT